MTVKAAHVARLALSDKLRRRMHAGVPAVSVLLVTYNHAPYIDQALDSILSQKTSFGFEVLVHDDCSTDGTLKILESWRDSFPQTIRLFTEERNRMGEYRCGYFTEALAPHAEGKYVAFCEGDDYWRDPMKLQRQFDYMEGNPTCVECNHAALLIDMQTGFEGPFGMGDVTCDMNVADIVSKWRVPTASRFIRKESLGDYADTWTFDKPAGDFPLAVYLASQGPVHYDATMASVYRFRCPGSFTAKTHSEEYIVNNARRWIAMIEEIDAKTAGSCHDELADHVVRYSEIIEKHAGDAFQLPAYAQEVLQSRGVRLDAPHAP